LEELGLKIKGEVIERLLNWMIKEFEIDSSIFPPQLNLFENT
jgi:hypothetical protein